LNPSFLTLYPLLGFFSFKCAQRFAITRREKRDRHLKKSYKESGPMRIQKRTTKAFLCIVFVLALLSFLNPFSPCEGTAWAIGPYTDNGNETVSDLSTGLMWQKISDFQLYKWQSAMDYCDGFNLAGYDDWRLPEVDELFDLHFPVIGFNEVFEGPVATYWASTEYSVIPRLRWAMSFDYGYRLTTSPQETFHVRCVRVDDSVPPGDPGGDPEPPPDPTEITVAIDIKPQSCVNQVNVNSKGPLRVAVLGTVVFDVMSLDPSSVLLEGISPIRWSLKDVGTPREPTDPFIEESDQCHDRGHDGFEDLVLIFDTHEIVQTLGDVANGEEILLTLEGTLTGDTAMTSILAGGTVLGEAVVQGKDTVVVQKAEKNKKK
jgi:hypothetical protein